MKKKRGIYGKYLQGQCVLTGKNTGESGRMSREWQRAKTEGK